MNFFRWRVPVLTNRTFIVREDEADENTDFDQSAVPAMDRTADAIVEHEDAEILAASIRERARQRSAAQTDDVDLDAMTMTFQKLIDSESDVTIKADDAPLWQVPIKVRLSGFPGYICTDLGRSAGWSKMLYGMYCSTWQHWRTGVERKMLRPVALLIDVQTSRGSCHLM